MCICCRDIGINDREQLRSLYISLSFCTQHISLSHNVFDLRQMLKKLLQNYCLLLKGNKDHCK